MDGTDAERDAQLRLKQAQAMLDLFEGDRRRAAVTLEELREWANAQDNEHLHLRVKNYLDYESEVLRAGSRARPTSRQHLALGSYVGSNVLERNRSLDAAALALEAEIASTLKQAKLVPEVITTDNDQRGRRPWWRRFVG
jgi:hypothetical protein